MSKKYVIDLPDDAQYILINGASENHCYTRVEQVEDLEELNSDYINENFGELQDEAYQAGLNDAWEAARKIVCDEGISAVDLMPIFGRGCDTSVLRDYTAQEAIDKIKAYEDKHSDRIEVGDEVTHKSDSAVWRAVCIRIDGDGRHMNLMGYTGAVGYYPVDDFKKTGRHFNIGEILEAMRNDR